MVVDTMQHTRQLVTAHHPPQLKYVNLEVQENHISHETLGLSSRHLVLRRGKPFKLTLLFSSRGWNPQTENLVFEVRLGGLSESIPVRFSQGLSDSPGWSAQIYPGSVHSQSATFLICSPPLSSVGFYNLLVHTENTQSRQSYAVGNFVLLCNPWLKDDPVYMPLDVHIEEYVKSDFGVVYMGTHLNVCRRPWAFGQYEPGVLEACLNLLQVSPQHLRDKHSDYLRRADPVYISRVACAMVNCNDDLGVMEGKWTGNYSDGTNPTEWTGSADILNQWASTNFSPVRYGQCWVYASVMCTVMRVLGIPCRVVTCFNAAHDTNGNLKIEEFYSTRGQKCEKVNLSKDSIWNFHVWVECWMWRADLGPGFGGWQVVDPTPQEKSGGVFCCGPCPVVAIQRRIVSVPFDTAFVYASVDADVVRLLVRGGLVVGRTVDTTSVGRLIYTKSIGSDRPENLTQNYKRSQKGPITALKKRYTAECRAQRPCGFKTNGKSLYRGEASGLSAAPRPDPYSVMLGAQTGGSLPSLEVSLKVEKVPLVGESVCVCVTITNRASVHRVLMARLNAQCKEYNGSAQDTFWETRRETHIGPAEVLTQHHTIPSSDYEPVLVGDNVLNVAVVIKDVRTKERVLATEEFNITLPQISIEVLGGDSIELRKEHTVHVSFTNTFTKALSSAVLTVEGPGLLQGKDHTRVILLQPGHTIEKKLSIMAASPGTKLLMASLSHSNSPSAVTRSFQRISVNTT